MSDAIVVALIGLVGSGLGAFIGVLTSAKLTPVMGWASLILLSITATGLLSPIDEGTKRPVR